MKSAHFFTILYLFLFLASLSTAQPDSPASSPQLQVSIPGTVVDSLTSTIVNQVYRLHIHFPRGYNDSTKKSFPALFLLDAQWDFPLAVAIYGQQYYDGFVPGFVTIGITWGGENPNADSLRARDFSPTQINNVPHLGKAKNFLAFIKTELIPYVEKRYRVSSSGRALAGSSLGGLFTLYAMLTDHTLFDRYVLTSPAIWWDNGAIMKIEKEFAAKHSSLPVRLFMAHGELEEGTEGFLSFARTLENRAYSGFQMRTRVLEGMGHSGGKAEGYTRGLQWVYAWPHVSLPVGTLDSYAGVYEVNPRYRITIAHEGDSLIVVFPDSSQVSLHARGENEFYVKGRFAVTRFIKDPTGKVTGLEAEEYSRVNHATKVE